MQRAKSANEFFAAEGPWSQELKILRKILKSTELVEEIKWGGPYYTCASANAVGVGGLQILFRPLVSPRRAAEG